MGHSEEKGGADRIGAREAPHRHTHIWVLISVHTWTQPIGQRPQSVPSGAAVGGPGLSSGDGLAGPGLRVSTCAGTAGGKLAPGPLLGMWPKDGLSQNSGGHCPEGLWFCHRVGTALQWRPQCPHGAGWSQWPRRVRVPYPLRLQTPGRRIARVACAGPAPGFNCRFPSLLSPAFRSCIALEQSKCNVSTSTVLNASLCSTR